MENNSINFDNSNDDGNFFDNLGKGLDNGENTPNTATNITAVEENNSNIINNDNSEMNINENVTIPNNDEENSNSAIDFGDIIGSHNNENNENSDINSNISSFGTNENNDNNDSMITTPPTTNSNIESSLSSNDSISTPIIVSDEDNNDNSINTPTSSTMETSEIEIESQEQQSDTNANSTGNDSDIVIEEDINTIAVDEEVPEITSPTNENETEVNKGDDEKVPEISNIVEDDSSNEEKQSQFDQLETQSTTATINTNSTINVNSPSSLFDDGNSNSETSSLFGGSDTNSAPSSLFGGNDLKVENTQTLHKSNSVPSSLFGGNDDNNTSSLFGGNNNSNSVPSSLFGGNDDNTSSPFGDNNSPSGLFGGDSNSNNIQSTPNAWGIDTNNVSNVFGVENNSNNNNTPNASVLFGGDSNSNNIQSTSNAWGDDTNNVSFGINDNSNGTSEPQSQGDIFGSGNKEGSEFESSKPKIEGVPGCLFGGSDSNDNDKSDLSDMNSREIDNRVPSNLFGKSDVNHDTNNNTVPSSLFGDDSNNTNLRNSNTGVPSSLFGDDNSTDTFSSSVVVENTTITKTIATTVTTATATNISGSNTPNKNNVNPFSSPSSANNSTSNLFGGNSRNPFSDNTIVNNNNSISSNINRNPFGDNSESNEFSFFDSLNQQIEQQEKQRIENERLEKERIEQQRIQQQLWEQQRIENERLEKERLEKQRIENERLQKERLEQQQKLEQQRIEQQKLYQQQQQLQQQQQQHGYNNNNNQFMNQSPPVMMNSPQSNNYYQQTPVYNNNYQAPPVGFNKYNNVGSVNGPNWNNSVQQHQPPPSMTSPPMQIPLATNNYQAPPPHQPPPNMTSPPMQIPLVNNNYQAPPMGSSNLHPPPMNTNGQSPSSSITSNSSSHSSGSYNNNQSQNNQLQSGSSSGSIPLYQPPPMSTSNPSSYDKNKMNQPPPPMRNTSHQRADSGGDQFTKLLNNQVRGPNQPSISGTPHSPSHNYGPPHSSIGYPSSPMTSYSTLPINTNNIPTSPHGPPPPMNSNSSSYTKNEINQPPSINVDNQPPMYSPYRQPIGNQSLPHSPSTSYSTLPINASNIQPPPIPSQVNSGIPLMPSTPVIMNQVTSPHNPLATSPIPSYYTPMGINEYQPQTIATPIMGMMNNNNVMMNNMAMGYNNGMNIGMNVSNTAPMGYNTMSMSHRPNPLLYSKPHPVVAFGFGGRLLVIRSNSTLPNPPVPSTSSSPNSIKMLLVKNILQQSNSYQRLLSFPGPLTSSTSKDTVNKWIQDRISEIQSRLHENQDAEASTLLWELLKHLCNNYGQFKTNQQKDGTQNPESSQQPDSLLNLLGEKNMNMTVFPNEVQKSESELNYIVNDIQRLVIQGNIIAAHKIAFDNQIWHHALVLSQQIGPEAYFKTLQSFTIQSLPVGSPLKTLYSIYSNNIKDLFKEVNQPPTPNISNSNNSVQTNSVFLDKWKENIATILFNGKGNAGKLIGEIGDCIWAVQRRCEAAHVCYLLADYQFGTFGNQSSRIVLLGGDHKLTRNYISIESLQRSEIYEYSKILGNSQYSLPILFVYKFIYATTLCDYGLIDLSLKYVNHIKNLLKNHQTTNPYFIYQLDTFNERLLSFSSSNKLSGSGSWIPSIFSKGFRILGKQSSSNALPSGTSPSISSSLPNIPIVTSPTTTPTKPPMATIPEKINPTTPSKISTEDEDLYNSFSNKPKKTNVDNDNGFNNSGFSNSSSSKDDKSSNSTNTTGDDKNLDDEDQPKSWFSKMFSKRPKAKQMILENDGEMYYDQALGWVERGKEAQALAASNEPPPPPPPSFTPTHPGTPPMNTNSPPHGIPNAGGVPPPSMPGTSSPQPPMSTSSSNLPPSLGSSTGNQYSSLVSPNTSGARRKPRYVDTFNNTVYTGQSPNSVPKQEPTNLNSSFTAFVPTFDPNSYQPPEPTIPTTQPPSIEGSMDQPPMNQPPPMNHPPPMIFTPFTPPPN